MKRKTSLLLIVALLGFIRTVKAQYEIKLEISGCKDSCLILGHYYLDKTYAIDTAWNKNGRFVFKKKDKKLESGIYFFSTLKGKFCEFMVDKEQNFTLKTDDKDWTYDMKVKGSQTAAIYFDYMKSNKLLTEKVTQLSQDKPSLSEEEYAEKMKQLQQYGDSLKNVFIEKHPEHLLTKVLTATKPVVIPDMPVPTKADGSPDSTEWQNERWYYYKQHYFDNIDLSCSGLLRTPSAVFNRTYEYFWNEVMKYEPVDSILVYADRVIERTAS